jgi:hypothetical protein
MNENITYTPSDWAMIIRALQIMELTPGDNMALIETIRAHVKPPSHAPIAIAFSERDLGTIKTAEHFAFPPGMWVRTPERGY